jgi:hypothetical protein
MDIETPLYQYRLLDHRYHLLRCVEHAHSSDRIACISARSSFPNSIIEVWQDERFVCGIGSDGAISVR